MKIRNFISTVDFYQVTICQRGTEIHNPQFAFDNPVMSRVWGRWMMRLERVQERNVKAAEWVDAHWQLIRPVEAKCNGES